MCGTTAREPRKTPLRLTEMTESNASSVIVPATAPSFHLTNCESRVMPALLMSTSTAPHRPTTSSTADSTSAAFTTLTFWKSASPPSEDRARSNSSCPASLTSHAATRQPSLAKHRAVARPIPAAAPVTMTTLPRRPGSFMRPLKVVLQRKLDHPGPRGSRGERPKAPRAHYVHGVSKIHVVEQIEEFSSELHLLAFRDRKELHNGKIRVDLLRTSNDVPDRKST